MTGGDSEGVLFSALHPAAQAEVPHTSVLTWIVFAVVLGVVIASGLVLSSRR